MVFPYTKREQEMTWEESDFDVDNSPQLFFDAQEAKKVSKHTVVRWI